LGELRQYWNLDSLVGWPDPTIIDPCDNIPSYPGLLCNIDDPAGIEEIGLYICF